MDRRRALIAAHDKPFFIKASGKYIDTGISAKLANTSVPRTIVLDFAPTQFLSGVWFYGVASTANNNRNRFGCYLSGNIPVLRYHTGNVDSATISSTVHITTDKNYKIVVHQNPSNPYLSIDVNGIGGTATNSNYNSYTSDVSMYFGACHGVSAVYNAWEGNIFRFSIYNAATEDKNALIYQLLPREDNGVIKPYETVSGQFAAWLTA